MNTSIIIFLALWISWAPVISLAGYVDAAQKLDVPKFKNVDEAIGWVKAKGDCEKFGKDIYGKDIEGTRCKIRLDLPDEKLPELGRESVWSVWAWMGIFELDSAKMRNFSVDIVRSKYVSLSASDPKATVRSGKVSRYSFDSSGKVTEAIIEFFLENFKEERILDQTILIPLGSLLKHDKGIEDWILLTQHLGISWDYK